MISTVSVGFAEIPESEPAEPVVVAVPIRPNIVGDYDVEVIRPATLPPEDVEVTGQSTTEVELTVTRPDGYAGTPGLTVQVLCTQDTNFFVDGPGDISGLLDAGWTGTTALYKDGANVYLQVNLTATASIDGTPKSDTVALLDGLDSAYSNLWGVGGVFVGYFYDENKQLIGVTQGGLSMSVEGMAGATDDWVDGVSKLKGQVTWLGLDPQPPA